MECASSNSLKYSLPFFEKFYRKYGDPEMCGLSLLPFSFNIGNTCAACKNSCLGKENWFECIIWEQWFHEFYFMTGLHFYWLRFCSALDFIDWSLHANFILICFFFMPDCDGWTKCYKTFSTRNGNNLCRIWYKLKSWILWWMDTFTFFKICCPEWWWNAHSAWWMILVPG